MTDKRELMNRVRGRLYAWGRVYEDITTAGYTPEALEYRLMREGSDGARSTTRGHGATLAAVIRWGEVLGTHNAYRSIPEIHRLVIRAKYCLGMSSGEIATATGLPVQRVQYRIADAEESIGRYMFPQDFEGLDKNMSVKQNFG